MVRCNRVPKALISTEFIFVFPIALTVVLAIMGFGLRATSGRESTIRWRTSQTSYPRDGIPWSERSRDRARERVCRCGPDCLTVKNASVTLDSDEDLGQGSAVAGDLGTENLRTESRTVTVSAEIVYDYPAPYNVFGKRSVRNITRSYISYADWEVI